MPSSDDERVGILSRALHTFHGRGYCSQGAHQPGSNYYCYDEARVIIATLDGEIGAGDIPDTTPALTLSARQEKRRARAHRV